MHPLSSDASPAAAPKPTRVLGRRVARANGPIHPARRRGLDRAFTDRIRLPLHLCDTAARAVLGILDELGSPAGLGLSELVPITPGSIGQFVEPADAERRGGAA